MSQLKLSSQEGQVFRLSLNEAILSNTIKSIIDYPDNNEDLENWNIPDDIIPLPNVNSNTLLKIIEYIKYHNNTNDNEEDKDKWDNSFLKVDDELLFNIILASNYLEIPKLLDLTCKTVANYIKKCKTPQEIRKRFNIKNDFTPEEEEEIRKDNAWCEDI